MLYAAHEYEDSVDEYRLALAGRPDDATLKRGLDRARKKLGRRQAGAARAQRRAPRRPRRRTTRPPRAADDAAQDARRRQRRPSRLPTSSSSCIASARSPSIFSRPSSSVCMGGDRARAHALERRAVDAHRRARPPGADARLAEADVQRPAPPPPPLDLEQQPPGDLPHQIDVARLGEQKVARRPLRRAAATGRSGSGAPSATRRSATDWRIQMSGGSRPAGRDRQRRAVGVDLPGPAARARDADAHHRRPRRARAGRSPRTRPAASVRIVPRPRCRAEAYPSSASTVRDYTPPGR